MASRTGTAVMFAIGVLVVAVFGGVWLRARPPQPMVVRSYEVPPEIAREVAEVLSSALGAPRPNAAMTPMIGRAIVAPGGQIVVTAAPEVQKGVAQVIAGIAARTLPPTPVVHFDLWIVTGTPGTAPARGTAIPEEVSPALDSLRKSRGDLHFQLVDHLSTSARSGDDDARVSGSGTDFRVSDLSLQKAADGKQHVVAQIRAMMFSPAGGGPAQLNSQAVLTPGDLLVVGQSLAGKLRDDIPGQEIYYIVRATL